MTQPTPTLDSLAAPVPGPGRGAEEIVLAADGAEAVALFARYGAEVAVVVTDLAMPIMDGPAAMRSIRRLSREVPILAMSGLADRYGTDEIEEHGISGFLTKPFSADDLLDRLEEALGSRSGA